MMRKQKRLITDQPFLFVDVTQLNYFFFFAAFFAAFLAGFFLAAFFAVFFAIAFEILVKHCLKTYRSYYKFS
jgi:predicted PurR-regulated permease PerM